MQEDKDFRSHYYERVGFRGVDERKMLDSLLREDPVSLNRCAAFALKCTVPSDRRRALWEAVLGISALYPSNTDYISRWRRQPFVDAREALADMKKIDDSRPPAQNLAVIYLLFARRLRFDFQKQLEEVEAQDFMAVAEAALSMCGGGVGGDEAAAFWIAKQFYGKIKSHLDKIGVAQELPLRSWFSRGFAGVLNVSALEKVWDKVVGGSLVVLVHVAIALVETSRTSLLGCQTPSEAIRCLNSTSIEADDQIAQSAIETWTRDGQQLLPPPPPPPAASSSSSSASAVA